MAATWDDARVGDELSVESHRLRGARRTGTIVETMGAPGHAYFRVRWQDGRETVFHPGPDAVLVPATPRPEPPPAAGRPQPGLRPAGATAPQPAEQGPGEPAVPELRASPGDRLVIRGHHLGEPDRDGEILEVLGEHGRPPFRVRWSDTGRVALLFPGADAGVEHYPRRRRRNALARA